MAFAATIIVSFACMVASGEYAVRRGRSRTAWVWVAAVIGPLALLALAVIPPKAA